MEDYIPHLFILVGVGILALLTYHAVRGGEKHFMAVHARRTSKKRES